MQLDNNCHKMRCFSQIYHQSPISKHLTICEVIKSHMIAIFARIPSALAISASFSLVRTSFSSPITAVGTYFLPVIYGAKSEGGQSVQLGKILNGFRRQKKGMTSTTINYHIGTNDYGLETYAAGKID